MALRYAHGPRRETTGIPGSVFTKGDILMFTSASSLSVIPHSSNSVGALAAGLVVGVALANSSASLNNQVPYIIADRDTVFWSDATIGSQFTAGESIDVETTSGAWRATTSAISPMLRVVPRGGSVDLNEVGGSNSNKSQILCKFDESQLQFRA
jgi:hypothetical protein